jgi:hypothetical protein
MWARVGDRGEPRVVVLSERHAEHDAIEVEVLVGSAGVGVVLGAGAGTACSAGLAAMPASDDVVSQLAHDGLSPYGLFRLSPTECTRRRERDDEELYRSCDSRMYAMRPTKS